MRGLARVSQRSTSVIMAVAASWLIATGIAAGAQQPSSRAKAKAEAARELAALTLPSGATEVSSDPSKGSVLKPSPTPVTNPRYVVDDHRYWRVPGSPSAVVSWIRSHPPAHADASFSGSPSSSGVYSFGWGFPYSKEVVLQALDVQVAPATGGGSAIRADGVAVWVRPHPGWDQVPSSAKVMTIWRRVKGKHSGPVTIRNPRDVHRVARFLDRADLIPPVIEHCPAGFADTFKVVFQARQGGPVLAQSHGNPTGCAFIDMAVRGRRGPALDGAYKLVQILDRLIGWRQRT